MRGAEVCISTLPSRGRVGAKRRGGVTACTSLTFTPTRSCAATSPLKGEVGLPMSRTDRLGRRAARSKLSLSPQIPQIPR